MKPFREALEPDCRWQIFMTDDPVAGMRPVSFADHYADTCKLNLPPVGSPLVERLYERAQHCLLYSWLDYELSLLAEAQAFSALDLALKLRIEDPKIVNLSPRLSHAVKQGWITAPAPKPVGMPDDWQNTHQLLLHLRNDIIHGSAQVHDFSIAATVFDYIRVMICELNQVAPPPPWRAPIFLSPPLNDQPPEQSLADLDLSAEV